MIDQIGMLIQEILDLLHKYPVQMMGMWATSQWLFGVVVDALPEPENGDRMYKMTYKIAHGLAGNRSEYKKNF